MTTTHRDIFTVLPLEIAQRCIAEACEGSQYMASLLVLTMVSRDWCRILMETPTLWASIHVNDADEDSMATIALFLYLSCEVQLSLNIWVPLSLGWDTISTILLPCRDRIRKVTLQTDSDSHSAECGFKTDISDAAILHNLQRVFETLGLPTSVEYLDIILDRPVSMDLTWVPPKLASVGNWLIPLRILESSSQSFPKLRYLSMNVTDLAALFPHLSVLGQLQHLHFHSEEQDYIDPPPPPSATDDMAPLHMPFLNTLQYHGRLYWASTKLLIAAAQTIQNLDLQIGVLDLNVAMNALVASKSLRRFSLTLLWLEYDLDRSGRRRLYLPMNITNQTSRIKTPAWQLKQLEDFRCEMKSFRSGQVSANIDLDHLWQFFHTIFPELHILVWHLPIQSDGLLISLIRQKQLRYFESNIILAPSSRQLTGFVLSSLESLRVKDVQMFRDMAIPNLLHFSATCLKDFIIPAGFTFTQLRSLDLKIGKGVKTLHDMSSGDFPLLKVLSLTFLGPHGHFPLLDLPSLTEITISTKSPTFTQGMRFCASLMYEPWKCPRLEQINLDSFLEWDLLYLLLRARNSPEHASVSRIKTLRVPLLPPKFRPMFVQLLAGCHISSLPSFWSLMKQVSSQRAQSRLLDQHVMGCFKCVYWGLGDCPEPINASNLPREYHGEDSVLSDKIEPLDLFPLHSWDMPRPLICTLWMYENIWIMGHRKGAERWRNEAYAWSKLHHRTLSCHKWCSNAKTLVTAHDMEGNESRPLMSSPVLFRPLEHGEELLNSNELANTGLKLNFVMQSGLPFHLSLNHQDTADAWSKAEPREVIRTIPSLIELLQNQDCDVRSSTASALEKLLEHVEPRHVIEAVIPSLVERLENGSFDIGTTAASALATLADHAEFRNAIYAVIPSFIKLLKDSYPDVRSTAASTLAKLAEHAEFRIAIHATTQSFVELLRDVDSNVRSTAASTLAKLAKPAEFRNAIHAAMPSFVELLGDTDSDVRSAAASALSKLAEHAEFRIVIHAAIPSLINLLRDRYSDVQSVAASALAKLAEYAEFRNAIYAVIPSLIELLKDSYPDVRSTAASALAKLAERAEFRNVIDTAIPSLIELLKVRYSRSQFIAASVLATLAEHAEFRNAIHAAIPSLVELLNDKFSYVRSVAASTLSKLAEHAEFRNTIHTAIPSLIKLLRDRYPDVRSATASAIAKLVEHTELRNSIHAAIPSLVELLNDTNSDVRSAAASALAKLAEHGDLPSDIVVVDLSRPAIGP